VAAFDTPRTNDRVHTHDPDPGSDPDLVALTDAIEAATGHKTSDPRLVASGPWPRKERGLHHLSEVRVWRADRGGPRVRVTTVADRAGERWYATIPEVPVWHEPEPPVRRARVGEDLGPFIEALLIDCAPQGRM
jgi:hypothetical protein